MDELKERFPTPLGVLQADEREIDETVLAACVERVASMKSPIPGPRFFSLSELFNLYSPMDMPPDQRGNLQQVLDLFADSFGRLETGGYIKHAFDQPAGAMTVTEKGRKGLPPQRATTSKRRLAAILVIDTVGFSRLIGLDEEGTLARLNSIRDELTDPTLARFNGRIFNTTGDGLLAEFASVVDAMRCGIAIQTAMESRNTAAPAEHQLQFRVGIHLGDVLVQADGNVLGDGVNIAARLEPLAAPGGIHISGQVKESVEGKLDVTFEDMGDQNLKNIAHPVRAYRVHFADASGGISVRSTRSDGLIALGPDVVCSGELTGFSADQWELRLDKFVIGNVGKLMSFAERFGQFPSDQRYILVNSLGDGRLLASAPALTKVLIGHVIKCPILPKTARQRAQDLPATIALSPGHDNYVKNKTIPLISGAEALPQHLKTILSLQRGELLFHRNFGTNLAEYYHTYRAEPWLEALLRLEVIRQAAIPHQNDLQNRDATPLRCVDFVWDLQILSDAPQNRWLPIRLDLDVVGIGRQQHELTVCIPDSKREPAKIC